jgi:ATP-dependent helicase HrpA
VQRQIEAHDHRTGAWHQVARRFEKSGVTSWTFGDLPESVFVEEVGGAPLLAFPGIESAGESVSIRLYRKQGEAAAATRGGVRKLVELGVARDLVGLRKELLQTARRLQAPNRDSGAIKGGFQALGQQLQKAVPAYSPEAFQEAGVQRLLEAAFVWEPVHPLSSARFVEFLEKGRRLLPGLAYQLGEFARQILAAKEVLKGMQKPYPGMSVDLQRLVSDDFVNHTPFERLQHLPRYLRAMQVRAERAALKPVKDAEKAAQLAEFEGWRSKVAKADHERFRWLLEEFRVSLFAQELGTAESVSSTKLKALGSW